MKHLHAQMMLMKHLYAQMMLADDEGKKGLTHHERNSRSFKLHALQHARSICVCVRQSLAGRLSGVDEWLGLS
jgi:hypothetical protein